MKPDKKKRKNGTLLSKHEKHAFGAKEQKKMLKKYTGQKVSESASIPSAQNTKAYLKRMIPERELDTLVSSIYADRELSDLVKACVELLHREGLRISEVLNIHSSDISSRGVIRIKGLKHSNDRFVQGAIYNKIWIDLSKKNYSVIDIYSRFYFYRLFKRKGIVYKKTNNSKSSVTHAFRHMYAESVYSISQEIENVKTSLAHKNVNSSKYYVGNKKK